MIGVSRLCSIAANSATPATEIAFRQADVADQGRNFVPYLGPDTMVQFVLRESKESLP
jgi:hypothetical protein